MSFRQRHNQTYGVLDATRQKWTANNAQQRNQNNAVLDATRQKWTANNAQQRNQTYAILDATRHKWTANIAQQHNQTYAVLDAHVRVLQLNGIAAIASVAVEVVLSPPNSADPTGIAMELPLCGVIICVRTSVGEVLCSTNACPAAIQSFILKPCLNMWRRFGQTWSLCTNVVLVLENG